MGRIRRLDDRLISQIAAGEVVERPASVVKEAVENALDAGAKRIEVELEQGGRGRILVRDDGFGMEAADAQLAFERHATSKIADFDDLLQVATLGFRGEALAAIAAVSKVELLSAVSSGEGHRVRSEGGRVTLFEPSPAPRGTRLDVRSLFFNVPARRKFLKRPSTELRRSLEVLQGYALARPDVAFRLRHEDRELLRADATSDDEIGRTERIAQLFGAELAANLARIGPGVGAGISGFVGNPRTVRGRRLFVFVNRRLIRDRAMLAVFYRCVRKEWGSERFPALFLFLDLEPREVDVNVHPQKSEVRFRDPRLLDRVAGHLAAALSFTRGEVEAPLRSAQLGPAALPPPAWEGAGSRSASSGSLVAEPRFAEQASGPRIAETTYPPAAQSSPLQSRPSGVSYAAAKWSPRRKYSGRSTTALVPSTAASFGCAPAWVAVRVPSAPSA